MNNETLFIINNKQVLVNIQAGEIVKTDTPALTSIVEDLIKEWKITDNTTDVIDYTAQTVVITDPLNKQHQCQIIRESRRERDSQQNTYMQSLTGTESLLVDYEEYGFDIDKAGIIELVSYALGEGVKADNYEEYNFSFKLLNQNIQTTQ